LKISIDIRARRWPGIVTRTIVILIIVLVTAHWAPDVAIPLGFGGWLGTWAASRPPANETCKDPA
jgi:hypothetical protein